MQSQMERLEAEWSAKRKQVGKALPNPSHWMDGPQDCSLHASIQRCLHAWCCAGQRRCGSLGCEAGPPAQSRLQVIRHSRQQDNSLNVWGNIGGASGSRSLAFPEQQCSNAASVAQTGLGRNPMWRMRKRRPSAEASALPPTRCANRCSAAAVNHCVLRPWWHFTRVGPPRAHAQTA